MLMAHSRRWAAKRARLVAGGLGKLHVVLDFDHTLTAFQTADGTRCLECHDMVREFPGWVGLRDACLSAAALRCARLPLGAALPFDGPGVPERHRAGLGRQP